MSPREELQRMLEDEQESMFEDNGILYPYPDGLTVPCSPSTKQQDLENGFGGKRDNSVRVVHIRQNAIPFKTGDSAISPTGDSNSEDDSGDSNLIPPSSRA